MCILYMLHEVQVLSRSGSHDFVAEVPLASQKSDDVRSFGHITAQQ